MCTQSLQSCLITCNPLDCSSPGSLIPGILRAKILYWVAVLCPPPGDLPNLGMEPTSPASPALQADCLLLSRRGSPVCMVLT